MNDSKINKFTQINNLFHLQEQAQIVCWEGPRGGDYSVAQINGTFNSTK